MSRPGSRPLFARLWMRCSPLLEPAGLAAHRARLLEGLTGRVVEVGAGTGTSFGQYPAVATEVVAVEPEERLRARADAAATHAPASVRVVAGLADALPLGDGTVDAAVTSLVLCSVPDQARALAELRRVLRPGGELRCLEHVRGTGATAVVQRVFDRVGWPVFAGGCHISRDTVSAVRDAGFTVTSLERFLFPAQWGSPARPHVRLVARAPG